MGKIKVGVVGGAGYTGGEVIRLLLNHPFVELVFVQSRSNSGVPLYKVHSDLLGDTTMNFCSEVQEADVLFLCMGHGESAKFLDNNPTDSKIIDLSSDYRLGSERFIYGLVELNREKIANSSYIANPGCFATAITLALLPLASGQMLRDDIHVSAITGSTGAGQALSVTSHFSWRSSNMSTYKNFTHQHLAEIGQSIAQLQGNFNYDINFIPYRGDFTRGIIASVYTKTDLSLDELIDLYDQFYAKSRFTHVTKDSISLKQVVNTNKCILSIEKHGDKVLITSVIDNLLKGAAGQAVENMNLMFGIENNLGLQLKGSAF